MAPTSGSGSTSSYHHVADIPSDLIEYHQQNLHTGRGNGHEIAVVDTIVRGLAQHPKLVPLVEDGRVCYLAGAKSGGEHRAVDLVLGSPPSGTPLAFDSHVGMLTGMPVIVRASGEFKSIMTDLSKNQGNRAQDLQAHAQAVVGQHGPECLSFGVCHVNAADEYYSPTNRQPWRGGGQGKGLTRANVAVSTIRHRVPVRNVPGQPGLDALWTPVLVTNNHPDSAQRTARWLDRHPMPPDGDPLSYTAFIDRLATRLAALL